MSVNENAITYDYKTIKVKREYETIVCDAYENLGWELTNTSASENSLFYINLSFKRNRKIENKMELTKLQEKVDNILANIENLQTKKKNAGVVEGISTGVVGALIFGGGMSMSMLNTASVGLLVGGIAVGIVGITVGLLGWLVLKKINKKKNTKIQPILESEFDKLADVCEQAHGLIK